MIDNSAANPGLHRTGHMDHGDRAIPDDYPYHRPMAATKR